MKKSEFIKYLTSGGRVRMITFRGDAVPTGHKLAGDRQAMKVQGNAIQFTGGSWLYFDEIKASAMSEVAAGMPWPAVNIGWATYQLLDNPAEEVTAR
jgi:hypothetical protein